MDNTTHELLAPDVLTAAKTTAREWPTLIDQEDAEQEIWMVLLEGGSHGLDVLCGMDRAQRVSTLTTYGHRIGSRYRDDHEQFSGNYTYGTQHVRALLEADGLTVDDGRPDSLTTTERIDMTIGMERLVEKNANYAFAITEAYANGNFDHDGSKGKTLSRAVDSLALEMNRVNRSRVSNYTEGPGSRR